MALLGTMQPTSRFGEVFQYSNLMAAAAGFIGGSLAVPGKELGAAYDQAMSAKIFTPLGMTHTTFDFARALKGDVAQPHGETVDGKVARARMDLNESIVPARPAGGVWTSAHDLSRYVMMELAKGNLPNGKRLVSEENLLARRAPQVLVSRTHLRHGSLRRQALRTPVAPRRRSRQVPQRHVLVPEYNVGGVILANADSGVLRRALLAGSSS
jgi:CubicO group peptidase (beta-lactamase class C family)